MQEYTRKRQSLPMVRPTCVKWVMTVYYAKVSSPAFVPVLTLMEWWGGDPLPERFVQPRTPTMVPALF